MQLRNSTASYGVVSKTFHWLMALIIICMLCVGFYMGDVEDLTTKIKLYGLHKSTGVLVLTLVSLRVLWHIYSHRPGLVEDMKPWEKLAAKAGHLFLYLAMFGMPMSGWLLSSAAGRPVSFFGLFTLPDLIAPDDALRDIFGIVHEFLAFALIAMILGHVAAALKHHFVNKDATLRRMLPLIAFFCLLSLPALADDVQKWAVIKDQSNLTFSGKQMGKDFTGTFTDFTADISFDPDNLPASHVSATINIASLDSKDTERDGAAKGKDWLDAQSFPQARFESSAFKKTGENAYEAVGNLTIKDVTLPLTLSFTLVFTTNDSGKKTAEMDASALIERSKYQLGQGEWADESVIANHISVTLHLSTIATDS